MTLIDSNIFMYAAGGAHPHRDRCLALLERVSKGRTNAAVDAEVLQEILHRYRLLHRHAEGEALYDSTRLLFPSVLPITAAVMDRTRELMHEIPELVARDAVHAAVVQTYRLDAICTFDRDFERIRGLKRTEP